MTLSFLGTGLSAKEQVAAAWFGPKGFASVVYALYVLTSGLDNGMQVFDLIAGTVVLSILLHSSTDVVVARWFDDEWEVPHWYGKLRKGG